jgi:hypothetical protein
MRDQQEPTLTVSQKRPFLERSIQCQKGAPILIAANQWGTEWGTAKVAG